MQPPRASEQAFTLIELLAVMAIILLMGSLSIPAINGLAGGNQLSNASRLVSNLMTIARTEAITQRTLTRIAVVEDWPDDAEAAYRKIGIWKYDASKAEPWVQMSKWEELPQGVAFDPGASSYIGELDTNNVLYDNATNLFEMEVGGKTIKTKYVEFLPTGALRVPGITDLDIWVGLSNQRQAQASNWAKISASVLTGRLKITRP